MGGGPIDVGSAGRGHVRHSGGGALHLLLAVKLRGKKELVSQCYIKGHPGNEKDGVWKGIKDPRQRENVTVDFAALAGSKLGELAAKWDIVMGVTPEHG